MRVEPAGLATRPFQQPGTALHVSRRLFNALPALIDDRALPRPQLVESLPELNSESGRLFPDGQNNRWRGGNRGGWSAPEYDRLITTFNRTMDRGERVQLVRQLLRIYGEELPAISLFFRAQPFAHVAALKGPAVAAPESSVIWNVHEWEFR